jgi:glucosamine--fructose-6-phosphate aminotransferase (isomerizing)
MERAKSTLAIINNQGSSMGIRATKVLPIFMGKEVSVASTKATVGQMLAFLRWANHLGLKIDLNSIPLIMRDFIDTQLEQVNQVAKICSEYKNIFIIGRGILYPIALEAALKIKELTYIHAEGLCSAELKHGPLALIDSNFLTICLSPHQEDAFHEIRARGGATIVFTALPKLSPGSLIVEMPEVDPLLLPF